MTAASSAFTFCASLLSGTPAACSSRCTAGTREAPPTSTTLATSSMRRLERLSSSVTGAEKRRRRPLLRRRASNASRETVVRRSRSSSRLSTLALASAFAESTCFTLFASRRRRAIARGSSRVGVLRWCCASNASASMSRTSRSISRPPAPRSHAASSTVTLTASRRAVSDANSTSDARTAPEPAS